MNNELTKTFSPTNDQGGLDTRFEEDLRIIFQSIGADVFRGLSKFYQQTSELEKNYGGYATKLCDAFFKRIEYLDQNEREGSNQYRWKSKMLKKCLREGLKEIGFKPSKVSKIIGASEFLSSLHPNHIHRKQIEAMPIGSQYALSRMSQEGMNKCFNPFNDDDIPTKAELESIARSYPKNPFETRGRGPRVLPSEDDSNSTRELLEQTQGELVRDLVSTALKIDLEVVFCDDDLRADLEVASRELITLGEMGVQIPTKPTYV